MLVDILLPLLFIGLGLSCLIFSQQVGVGFCKLGKQTWKSGTFGLTDMRWLYPEDKAPHVFQIIGGIFLAGGLLFLTIFLLSFSGPGSLYAMREAGVYLKRNYGGSGGNWSMSASNDAPDASRVTITYSHGNRSGVLKAQWDGEKYVFSEVKQELNTTTR